MSSFHCTVHSTFIALASDSQKEVQVTRLAVVLQRFRLEILASSLARLYEAVQFALAVLLAELEMLLLNAIQHHTLCIRAYEYCFSVILCMAAQKLCHVARAPRLGALVGGPPIRDLILVAL